MQHPVHRYSGTEKFVESQFKVEVAAAVYHAQPEEASEAVSPGAAEEAAVSQMPYLSPCYSVPAISDGTLQRLEAILWPGSEAVISCTAKQPR